MFFPFSIYRRPLQRLHRCERQQEVQGYEGGEGQGLCLQHRALQQGRQRGGHHRGRRAACHRPPGRGHGPHLDCGYV